MESNNKRVYATPEQVIALLNICRDNLRERKNGKDTAYWKGVGDLIKEAQRWLGE